MRPPTGTAFTTAGEGGGAGGGGIGEMASPVPNSAGTPLAVRPSVPNGTVGPSEDGGCGCSGEMPNGATIGAPTCGRGAFWIVGGAESGMSAGRNARTNGAIGL